MRCDMSVLTEICLIYILENYIILEFLILTKTYRLGLYFIIK